VDGRKGSQGTGSQKKGKTERRSPSEYVGRRAKHLQITNALKQYTKTTNYKMTEEGFNINLTVGPTQKSNGRFPFNS